jgi:two-component system sensor histidine kinase KdpD
MTENETASAHGVLPRRQDVSGGQAPPCSEFLLSRFTRLLLASAGMTELCAAIEDSFTAVFGLPMCLVAPAGAPRVIHAAAHFVPNPADLSLAAECMRTPARAERRGGDGVSWFLPLLTGEGVVGALGFKSPSGRSPLSPEEWTLLHAFAEQTALALLRVRCREEARNTAALRNANEFYLALLDSIAHSLRTPLTCIIGALSNLEFHSETLDARGRVELLHQARTGAERLNRIIGALLDISRLESGAISVRHDLCEVADVIGASLEQLGLTDSARVRVVAPPSLPFVRMDFVLIVQVLVNLLDNAVKYSGPDCEILLESRHIGDSVEFAVSDSGEGIPEDELDRVFEKFRRVGRTQNSAGIGLGLSISKGLVEAHGGHIRAERRLPRGVTVRFTIPIERKKAG